MSALPTTLASLPGWPDAWPKTAQYTRSETHATTCYVDHAFANAALAELAEAVREEHKYRMMNCEWAERAEEHFIAAESALAVAEGRLAEAEGERDKWKSEHDEMRRFEIRVAERQGQFFAQSVWDDLAEYDRTHPAAPPDAETGGDDD